MTGWPTVNEIHSSHLPMYLLKWSNEYSNMNWEFIEQGYLMISISFKCGKFKSETSEDSSDFLPTILFISAKQSCTLISWSSLFIMSCRLSLDWVLRYIVTITSVSDKLPYWTTRISLSSESERQILWWWWYKQIMIPVLIRGLKSSWRHHNWVTLQISTAIDSC